MFRIPGGGGRNTATGGRLQLEGATGGRRGGDCVLYVSRLRGARHRHGNGAVSGGTGGHTTGCDRGDRTHGGGEQCVLAYFGKDRDAVRRRGAGGGGCGVAMGDGWKIVRRGALAPSDGGVQQI